MEGIPRTTNQQESWHHRWNTIVGVHHIGIMRFIEELRKEQPQVEGKIENIIAGKNSPAKKRSYIEKENQIKTILLKRETIPQMEFLRGLAHILHL